jgi:hypothetical protein
LKGVFIINAMLKHPVTSINSTILIYLYVTELDKRSCWQIRCFHSKEY